MRNYDQVEGVASWITFLRTNPVTGFRQHLIGQYMYIYRTVPLERGKLRDTFVATGVGKQIGSSLCAS